MSDTLAIVITSINSYKKHERIYRLWEEVANEFNGLVLVVGDTKTPQDYPPEIFYSFKAQEAMQKELSTQIGINTYCRKELGYLHAFKWRGADWVFETDDDNEPIVPNMVLEIRRAMQLLAAPAPAPINVITPNHRNTFFNVLGCFDGRSDYWPRGLPFAYRIKIDARQQATVNPANMLCANWSPGREADFCALARLYKGEPNLRRNRNFAAPFIGPLHLGNNYCPFNSQATLWPKRSLEHMLFPLSCHQRAADLLRGYLLCQKCLFFDGMDCLTQDRNPHDILKDYEDEFIAAAYAPMWKYMPDDLSAFQLDYDRELRHRYTWKDAVNR